MPTQQELNDTYKNNLSGGITSKVSRDPNNNIILNNDKLNTNLIIEPLKWDYTNQSVNDVIETRFSYYTFPPRVTVVNRVSDDMKDVVLPDVVLEDQTQSKTFYVKYQPSQQAISEVDVLLANGEKPGGYFIDNNNSYWSPMIVNVGPLAVSISNNLRQNGNQVKGNRLLQTYQSAKKDFPFGPLDLYDIKADKSDPDDTINNRDPFIIYTPPGMNAAGSNAEIPYRIASMLEERMNAIKWGNLVDGNYQLDQTQAFVITKEILELGKDIQFTVRLQMNLILPVGGSNVALYNKMAFRLIKYSDNTTDRNLYKVLDIVSTLTQGNIANDVQKARANALQTAKDSLLQLKQQISSKQFEISSTAGSYNTYNAAVKREASLKTAYENSVNYYRSIDAFWSPTKRRNALNESNAIKTIYFASIETTKKALQTYNTHNAEMNALTSKLAGASSQVETITKTMGVYNPKSLKYIFFDGADGAWPGNPSIFTMTYILNKEDMKLGDRYEIEGLINYRNDANNPLFWPKPGLDIWQSFWEIKSLDN